MQGKTAADSLTAAAASPSKPSAAEMESQTKVLRVPIALQVICWLMVLFGDIGFDKAGVFGLDFDAFIIIAGVYVIALVAGVGLALVMGRKRLAAIQLIPIFIGLLLCLI
jgi:hypothetical protein